MAEGRSDEEAERGRVIPDEFRMDEELVDRWFRIPPDETIEIAIPRAALDALYVGIEKNYFATTNLASVVQIGDNPADREAMKNFLLETTIGLNALRHCWSIFMGLATKTKLDENLQVSRDGADEPA